MIKLSHQGLYMDENNGDDRQNLQWGVAIYTEFDGYIWYFKDVIYLL